MVANVIAERFSVEDKVATGGMGVVYRARDQVTGAVVAVKLIENPNPANRQRFLREVEVLSQLAHPAIAGYVSHGELSDGRPYLVMDWVSGETLYGCLNHRGLSIAETIRLGRRVADALGHAHALGVVHRDVKPTNVMLPDHDVDRVVVLDFGIARTAQPIGNLTATGSMIGTPSYMAPEQARGARDVDPRSDVFALGCMLFECLTGQMAFEGRNVLALVAKILLWDPPPPRTVNPEIPRELDELIVRMIAKDPAHRPADGADVARQLAAIAVTGTALQPRRRRAQAPLTQVNQVARSTSAVPFRLLTLVIATSLAAIDGAVDPDLAERTRATVGAALAEFDAQIELLQDGSIVVIASDGSPSDVVHHAIRCARAVRSVLPEALIAIASAEVAASKQDPMVVLGSLIEATVAALSQDAMAVVFAGITSPSRPVGVIRVDPLTATLLDESKLTRIKGVCYLRGEAANTTNPELHAALTTAAGTPTPQGSHGHVPSGRLCLVVRGEGLDASYPVPDFGRLAIGRAPESDIRIDHPSISRNHARLTVGDTLRVEDLGSANGTRVRDRWLQASASVEVALGEPIDVGAVVVIVQQLPARKT